MSRLVFVLLIARAVAAPISLRTQLVDRTTAGFDLRFHSSTAAVEPLALQAELDDNTPDGGLVFRVCHWPAPQSRQASPELARRAAKLRIAAGDTLPTQRLRDSTTTASVPGIAPPLSTDRYLRHALGQLRC